MDFRVSVAVCAHRDVKIQTWQTLWDLGGCPNPHITVHPVDGDALISRSRSRAATAFLKGKDDLLMFIDDDVVISTEDATKLMWLAMEKDNDIVGAAYCTKSKEKPGLAIRPLEQGPMTFGVGGALYPMRSISTGCMVIKREVLNRFINEGVAPLAVHGSTAYYPFFQHQKMIIDGHVEDVSEDWYFCEKAIKLGFKVWCDSTIKLGHIGPYVYTWDDIIETKNGLRKTYDQANFTVTAVSDLKRDEAVKA